MSAFTVAPGRLNEEVIVHACARNSKWHRWAAAGTSAVLLAAGAIAAAGPAQASPPALFTATQQTSLADVHPARLKGLGSSHDISWDEKSLMIDGQRQYIWSAEFHYWRLPSVSMWEDIIEKIKANGYSAISIYFNWSYHSPQQGVYDFTGIRDVDKLLDMAEDAGLFVIARPGPYINAETTRGGFPGWLTNVPGLARSDDPGYLAAADEWMGQINKILAKRQYVDGTGPIILYSIENELIPTDPSRQRYMSHLGEKVRRDGIKVPLYHNDFGRDGKWVPPSSDVPGTVETDGVDLYAFDAYPGQECANPDDLNVSWNVSDWGLYGPGGASGGGSASPKTPGFTAEFGNGWFDYWGSWGRYDCHAKRQGTGYERVFYGTNIINGLTLQNFYMVYGGTSWGWLPAPLVYTSYDYGSAIDEARQMREKMVANKQLGYMLRSVPAFRNPTKGDPVASSNPAVASYHNVDAQTGTDVYFAVHDDSRSRENSEFSLQVKTDQGAFRIPQQGSMRVDGEDAKFIVSDYDLGRQRLVYSTSEVMTHLSQGANDVAVLHGRDGEDGETVLAFDREPTVSVASGQATPTWDAASKTLRLNYVHKGLTEVAISGGGRAPMTLLLADDTSTASMWELESGNDNVLIAGPELARTAQIDGSSVHLQGDTTGNSPLRVWAPSAVASVTWNGQAVSTTRLVGSLSATAELAGPEKVALPSLTNWKYSPGSPESDPSFDDSSWARAEKTTTTSQTKPPAGQPVLNASDYGFHQGDIWYRGKFSSKDLKSLSFTYGAGAAGLLQVWLDGVYLGQDLVPAGAAWPQTMDTASFAIPDALKDGDHTLSVMVRNNAHNQNGGADDFFKEGRGLVSVTPAGTVTKPFAWKIQGNRGGEKIVDTVRGVPNVGGSFGERGGWNLPGFPDGSWQAASVPASTGTAGTSWYRTTFDLGVPAGHDASLGVQIGDPATTASAADYRAQLYVNGWNMGQYIANVGPQDTFVIPNGVLNPNGKNTLAVQVTSNGGAGNGLEAVRLLDLGTVRGGVPLTLNDSPAWSQDTYGAAQTVVTPSSSVTADASSVSAGQPFTVTGTLTNDTPAVLSGVDMSLPSPGAGWTAVANTISSTTASPGQTVTRTWRVTAPVGSGTGPFSLLVDSKYVANGVKNTSRAVGTVEFQDAQLLPRLEAEKATTSNKPIKTEDGRTQDGATAQAVGGLGGGDWLSFRGVDLSGGTSSMIINAANAKQDGSPSTLEIRKGGAQGELLGTLGFQNTGSAWNVYGSQRFAIAPVSGTQDITIVSKDGGIALNYVQFAKPLATAVGPALQGESASSSSRIFNRESGTSDGKPAVAIGGVQGGDWITFRAVAFASPGSGIQLTAANASTPTKPTRVEIRQGGRDGTLISTASFLPTGEGWGSYSTQQFDLRGLTGTQDVTLVFLDGSIAFDRAQFVTSATAQLQLDATASTRMIGGKAYVTVATVNRSAVPVQIDIVTPYGKKTFTNVLPGRKVSVSINSTKSTIPAGKATATASATIDGKKVTATVEAPYNAQ